MKMRTSQKSEQILSSSELITSAGRRKGGRGDVHPDIVHIAQDPCFAKEGSIIVDHKIT